MAIAITPTKFPKADLVGFTFDSHLTQYSASTPEFEGAGIFATTGLTLAGEEVLAKIQWLKARGRRKHGKVELFDLGHDCLSPWATNGNTAEQIVRWTGTCGASPSTL